jgi:hypothetical protein
VQLAVEPDPLRMQLEGLKAAVLLLLCQETLPVGVSGVLGDVSDTVTVHLVPPVQLTLVEVDRCVTVRLNEPELGEWVGSPLYIPVITWVPSERGLGV